MHLKPGVKPIGLRPELLLGIMVAREVYMAAGQRFTITSLNDGDHSDHSLHYEGMAVDIRTKDLHGITMGEIAMRIRERLGGDYDVVAEGAGTVNEHIHLEFDPK